MSLLLVAFFFALFAIVLLLFYVFADLPYQRKKEQEALLKANSVQQDGVWPPAPTTYSEPPAPEPWAWCMQCHRASTMNVTSDNNGYCGYADCSAAISDMVAWHDLRVRIAELPEQPAVGVVYANLVRVKEVEPRDVSRSSGKN